jgi:hypothetical protein
MTEHQGRVVAVDTMIVNAAGSEAPASTLVVRCSCGWQSPPSAIKQVIDVFYADHLAEVLPTGVGVPGMEPPDG